jgi:hypothetical protein
LLAVAIHEAIQSIAGTVEPALIAERHFEHAIPAIEVLWLLKKAAGIETRAVGNSFSGATNGSDGC